jgi:hypothetical protein
MKDDDLYLVCHPVKGRVPSCSSRVDKCYQCGCEVWRALSSPSEAVALCTPCALAEMEKLDPKDIEIRGPSKEQLKDILAHGSN